MIENFSQIYRDIVDQLERSAQDTSKNIAEDRALMPQLQRVSALVDQGKKLEAGISEVCAVAALTAAASETLHKRLRTALTKAHKEGIPQALTYEFVDSYALIEGVKSLLGGAVMRRTPIEIAHAAYTQARRAMEKLIELSIGYVDTSAYLSWLNQAYLPERTKVIEEQFISQVTC